MEVLKFSQGVQSCLMTYTTRSVLFAVKISGNTSFKFMGKQDQVLYLTCICLGRRFLVPLKCAYRWSHDPCCPCVLARSSSTYSAQTWQCDRSPAVLVSPEGLQAGIECFFISIIKFPLQHCHVEINGKTSFIRKTKETYFMPSLGFQMDAVERKFLTLFPNKS